MKVRIGRGNMKVRIGRGNKGRVDMKVKRGEMI